jgi:hypothetical protein
MLRNRYQPVSAVLVTLSGLRFDAAARDVDFHVLVCPTALSRATVSTTYFADGKNDENGAGAG